MLSEKNELLLEIEKWLIDIYSPSSGKAIDIGCGSGTYSVELIRKGLTVTLVDSSAEEMKRAVGSIVSLGMKDRIEQCLVQDASDLAEIGDSFFDLAICYGMLNFCLQNDDAVIKEIKRILKPGGIFLISVMSLYGYISNCWKRNDKLSVKDDLKILESGVNSSIHPPRKLYRSNDVLDFIDNAGLQLIQIGSAPILGNFLRFPFGHYKGSDIRNHIISVEKSACFMPGLRDIGTNIVVIAKKRSES